MTCLQKVLLCSFGIFKREQCEKNLVILPLLAREKKKRLRVGLQCIKHGWPGAARWGLWWFALF
jgi:hypothetical protein